MRVLVTGANGFLGTHLVKGLLAKGFDVTAFIRNPAQKESLSGLNCHFAVGDILDLQSLLSAFDGMEAVFHVAGAMSASPKERARLFEVNVEGVKNVITACTQKNIKRLIHVSSVVAVGSNLHPTDSPLTETSTNVTIGLGYGNYDSKRMGEELVIGACKRGEISAVVVNPGLIYGAGDAKKVIRKGNVMAAKGKLPFYTSGGVNIVAVEDVVRAMIEALSSGRNGERYLLTGDNVTIQELLTTISLSAGAKPPSKRLPEKMLSFLGGIFDSLGLKTQLCRENLFSATTFHWYDHSKAKKELGFSPKGHREAIQASVKWMKENHYLKADK